MGVGVGVGVGVGEGVADAVFVTVGTGIGAVPHAVRRSVPVITRPNTATEELFMSSEYLCPSGINREGYSVEKYTGCISP